MKAGEVAGLEARLRIALSQPPLALARRGSLLADAPAAARR
jgi:hypothetical protein